MHTILTALNLKAKAYAVRLHKLLGSHPLLVLPCWTLGSTSIHLTLPVWTTATLGRLSASLIVICSARLSPIKFTCRRPRWRRRRQLRTPLFRWGERFANKALSALGCGYRSLGCHSGRVTILTTCRQLKQAQLFYAWAENSFYLLGVIGLP
jgi:hypothetical protein